MFGRGLRHILWFPFLLLALTIILAVTIVLVTESSTVIQKPQGADEVIPSDEGVEGSFGEEEYKTSVARLLVSVWGADLAETSVDDLKSLRDQLVATRVPSTMRDVHIQLVAAVNQRIAGIEGDVEAAADADIRLTTLLAEQPWLR